MKPEPIADIVVVGAGAAGLLSAIMAKRHTSSANVLLVDSRQKIGAKILISGGTRCNVTHERVLPSDYQGGPRHFIKHVLQAFTPEQTLDFFKEIGVDLILEPTGKYFPVTHSGKTVLEALMKEADRLRVTLKTGMRIEGVRKKEDLFSLKDNTGEIFWTRRVILATGGLSLPETGSDGMGFKIAGHFGHRIIPTYPALTPLLTEDKDWQSLSGVTLEAELSFFRKGKKQTSARGSFLFTHFGFSGPAALDISRHFAACPADDQPAIFANFIPGNTEESLQNLILSKSGSGQSLKHFLSDEFMLPDSFLEVFLQKNKWVHLLVFSKLSLVNKRNIIRLLRESPLNVSGVTGYKKAEATAGGVSLEEVQFSTMESKLAPGLYFSGEVLDVDGRIGGFNFQWAWSSGTLAGRSAARSLAA